MAHHDVMEALQMPAPQSGEDGRRCRCGRPRARFERQYILDRLSANRGNLGNTARELGIERTNLYRKMKQLGIQAARAKPALSHVAVRIIRRCGSASHSAVAYGVSTAKQ